MLSRLWGYEKLRIWHILDSRLTDDCAFSPTHRPLPTTVTESLFLSLEPESVRP
jgi:hypothetical protein